MPRVGVNKWGHFFKASLSFTPENGKSVPDNSVSGSADGYCGLPAPSKDQKVVTPD